ncbi:amino acid adenylation domain-containing protein [Streptomyces sp. NPDC004435]|uniref:non-ribosomal peptide synthetase/MFS transporter n=1 Tax=Streptomyces sp. NPDC004435 TaxID=3364701 RepID=UPI00369AF192
MSTTDTTTPADPSPEPAPAPAPAPANGTAPPPAPASATATPAGPPPAPGPLAPALSDAKRELLRRRLASRAKPTAVIPRRAPGTPVPLSFAQERLWFMEQFAPGTSAYNIPVVRRLRGPLDAGALRAALDGSVARHETLRSRYPATEDGRPLLVVDPPGPAAFTLVEAADEAGAERIVDEAAAVPFDLEEGPLFRSLLVRLADDDHVLLLLVHHSVSDGWSSEVLLGEVLRSYAARVAGAPDPLPELAVQYGDFALWQRERLSGERLAAELAHWGRELGGVEPLELAFSRPRPPRQTFEGAGYAFSVDRPLLDRLTALGDRHDATPHMVLLAAFQILLSRYGGRRDFAVGSPVAGRPEPELEPLVGMFVNVLALPARLEGDPSFAELVRRTRETCLDAYAHQELPFAQLVSELNVPRDVSRPPVFQAVLAVQNYAVQRDDTALELPLEVEPFGVRASGTRFDLELFLQEWPEGLYGSFNYNTDLFAEEDVAVLAAHLGRLLDAVAAAPDVPLSGLDALTDEERAFETERFNDTAVDRPATTLTALFAEQAARTPDAVAVAVEDRPALTYRALDALADRIAARLAAEGVGPGDLVAVSAERSPELVAGLLGVLRSGAAYTPLEPDYPAERLAFLLADSDAPVLLTQRGLATPDGCAARVLLLDDPAEWPRARTVPAGPRPDDTAYLIYTSGSTGRPKGVPTTHRAIANRIRWMQEAYRIGPEDAVLQKTPTGFDVSVWEFFWPLTAGARIVLAKPGGQKDSGYLRDLIVSAGVTVAHFVPAMLTTFLTEEGVERCTGLRRVVCSGEALPPDAARELISRLPGLALANLYGPTEAAVDVSAWECAGPMETVPIGLPIDNTRLYVLDERLRPVPPGAPGELHIGGTAVALGYHRRPGLTATRFVPDPYGPPGSRLYRTGDLARRRPDGTLEHLGRIDQQIKLRGLRIEPGETEAALRAQPGIADAAVVLREDRPGDKRLVGYLVAAPGADEPDPSALRATLRRSLPDHQVPTAFTVVPALPLTPNGKLDRRALPVPTVHRAAGAAEPETPAELVLAEIWAEVLGLPRVGADENFFDLGGHSLLATQVVAKARRRLTEAGARPISVMDLFTHRTVRELAAVAARDERERGPRSLLHRLTRAVPAERRRLTLVCVPYGGGSAVVYQPVADALPADTELWAVAIPGHDLGVTEERLSFDELAEGIAAEVRERVEGPLVVYGHCAVGTALAVAVARSLEASGRELEGVYAGAQYPFAKPRSRLLTALGKIASLEPLVGDRTYANWLTGMGVDTSELDEEQVRFVIGNMRRDTLAAEDWFTRAIAEVADGAPRLRAPLVSLVGDRDPAADFYQERYREWLLLAERSAVAVLDEGGHFFITYRAVEVAEAVTRVHRAVLDGTTDALPAADPENSWWFHGETGPAADDDTAPVTAELGAPGSAAGSDSGTGSAPGPGADPDEGPQPGMGRFLLVAGGQLASIMGSALTEFALPIWILLETGSMARYALYAVVAMLPGILVGPLAGALVDRMDRRRVMLVGDVAAGATQAGLLVLLLTGQLRSWEVYVLLGVLSVALTFQRLAYASAVPQLVPKRYLGHANGIVQLAFGTAQFVVPLAAVALMAAIGLRGILVIDVISYAVAIGILLVVRFPRTLPWTRRESLVAEIRNGFAHAWRHRGFRSMLLWFAGLNVFLSPLFLLTTPLVLAFDDLGGAARVAVAGGAGALLGGVAMGFWGGPRRHRLRGMLALAGLLALAGAVTGLRANLWVVALGAFGMSFALALVNGIYATIVQTKVAQRFHGRVFALNTLVAWSTIPLGHGVVAPLGSAFFGPLMEPGGALAPVFGPLVGTGPGRGIALMYVLFGLAMAGLVVLGLRLPTLARFDRDVPDAEPDDLVGLRERARAAADRRARAGAADRGAATDIAERRAAPDAADRGARADARDRAAETDAAALRAKAGAS